MTRYRLIVAVIAVAVICLLQTTEGKRVRRTWNVCARRCIRDCRSRPFLHGGNDHVKECERNCYEFARTCKECNSVKTGCTECARGYTLIFGDRCSREAKEQWVSSVESFSSQYNDTLWTANEIVGKPDVYPQYGDIPEAWAPLESDSEDYIVVNFLWPVYATAVDVYETFNAGGVVKVSMLDFEYNKWVTVWQTNTTHFIQQSRIFSVPMKPQHYLSKRLRLDVDSRTSGSWVEIDAIKLKGYISR